MTCCHRPPAPHSHLHPQPHISRRIEKSDNKTASTFRSLAHHGETIELDLCLLAKLRSRPAFKKIPAKDPNLVKGWTRHGLARHLEGNSCLGPPVLKAKRRLSWYTQAISNVTPIYRVSTCRPAQLRQHQQAPRQRFMDINARSWRKGGRVVHYSSSFLPFFFLLLVKPVWPASFWRCTTKRVHDSSLSHSKPARYGFSSSSSA